MIDEPNGPQDDERRPEIERHTCLPADPVRVEAGEPVPETPTAQICPRCEAAVRRMLEGI